jgi:hypothetical protein
MDKVPRKDLIYVIDYDDDKMRCGVLNGTVPSAVADSGASSNVGRRTTLVPVPANHPIKYSSYQEDRQ